eukprot:839248-Pyramimonas_sp.AAC.3
MITIGLRCMHRRPTCLHNSNDEGNVRCKGLMNRALATRNALVQTATFGAMGAAVMHGVLKYALSATALWRAVHTPQRRKDAE